MATANEMLIAAFATSQKLLNRYTQDLTPAEYLHRACPGGNATAWIIGHLVMTERNALGKLGLSPQQLPALPDGFEKRFSREPEAPKAADFGDVAILIPLFNAHRQLLIDTVKNLPPAALDQPLDKPHPIVGATIGEMLSFIGGIHTSMHAGQVSLIRRSTGKPPVA